MNHYSFMGWIYVENNFCKLRLHIRKITNNFIYIMQISYARDCFTVHSSESPASNTATKYMLMIQFAYLHVSQQLYPRPPIRISWWRVMRRGGDAGNPRPTSTSSSATANRRAGDSRASSSAHLSPAHRTRQHPGTA